MRSYAGQAIVISGRGSILLQLSRKTLAILSCFTAVATTVMFTGCASDDADFSNGYEDQTLKDDNGAQYTLHQNEDGSETADYGNGKQVTFQRDSDGNLHYLSGAAGLIGGLAAGYFLFHGLNSPSGSWYDSTSKRYVSNGRPTRITEKERQSRIAPFIPAGRTLNKASSAVKSSTKSTTTKSSSSVKSSTSKGGFGSAGARGGGAS